MREFKDWLREAKIVHAGEPMISYDLPYIRQQIQENQVRILLKNNDNEVQPSGLKHRYSIDIAELELGDTRIEYNQITLIIGDILLIF